MTARPCPSRGAFTLLELLLVMAIMVLIMSLVVPAVTSILKGNQITQGTQTVLDQLAMAKQFAVSKNRVVEVRFYQFVDPSAGGSASRFRAVQNYELQDDGSAVALDKMQKLPNGVILDSNATLSTLLAAPKNGTGTLPGIAGTYKVCTVRLRPDGSTDLGSSAQKNWFATLHDDNKGDNLGSLPSNFAVIQIDPWTAQARVFRP
jgi:uncharacterized protein (TIGR02596 family)